MSENEWSGMKPGEMRAHIKALWRCTFRPGSYDKYFVRCMNGYDDDYELSERQHQYIRVLYWKYRRQLSTMTGIPPIPEQKVEMPAREIPPDNATLIRYTPDARKERREQAAKDALEQWNKKVQS